MNYLDPQGRYSVRVPEDWTRVEDATGVTLTVPSKKANIEVACQPGVTSADQFLASDRALLRRVDLGDIDPTQAKPRTIAGVAGLEVPWAGGKVPLQHISVYFVGRNCGWRIGLTTFPGVYPADFQTIFNKVVDSFSFGA